MDCTQQLVLAGAETLQDRSLTHCNTPQHAHAHCSIPQHSAAHCNALQHTATHGNTLQYTLQQRTAMRRPQQHSSCLQTQRLCCCSGLLQCLVAALWPRLQHAATYCNDSLQHSCSRAPRRRKIALQHAAIRCNMLQHTATHCNTLQHTATHCNALQQHTATQLVLDVYKTCTNRRALFCVHMYIHMYICTSTCTYRCTGWVATIRRLLKIIGLFCRI